MCMCICILYICICIYIHIYSHCLLPLHPNSITRFPYVYVCVYVYVYVYIYIYIYIYSQARVEFHMFTFLHHCCGLFAHSEHVYNIYVCTDILSFAPPPEFDYNILLCVCVFACVYISWISHVHMFKSFLRAVGTLKPLCFFACIWLQGSCNVCVQCMCKYSIYIIRTHIWIQSDTHWRTYSIWCIVYTYIHAYIHTYEYILTHTGAHRVFGV
jgi:hypothetical protein